MNNEQSAMNNKQGIGNKRKRDNPAYDKAYLLAIRIVKAFQYLSQEKREFVISRQLLKSGTSIGANLAEAVGAISDADLSAKVSIAYKEAQETKYWLNLLRDTGYIDDSAHDSIYAEVDEIAAILFATLKKTRINK